MDNRLLEACVKELLTQADKEGLDIMQMASDLIAFHELINRDERMKEGYELYSAITRIYNNKLKEIGIIGGDKE